MISVKFVDKWDVVLTKVPVRLPAIPQLGSALSLNGKMYMVKGALWNINTSPESPMNTVEVSIGLDPLYLEEDV